MATAKQRLLRPIEQQPDDASYEQLIRELAFSVLVRRGLRDSDEGRTISNEEMAGRIYAWSR